MITFFVEYKYFLETYVKSIWICLQLVVAYGPVDQRANRAESARADLYPAQLARRAE